MAIAVENVQTASVDTTTDLVITKPTGLSVGDLMIACIVGNTVATPSGWSLEVSFSSSFIFSKTADSGDVAASDFTFTATSSIPIMGALYRISGQSTSVTVLGTDSESVGIFDPYTTGVLSMATSLTPLAPDSLMILVGGSISGDLEWLGTVSSRVITGGTNPSWTERYEAHRTDAGNDSTGISVADATYADTDEITNVACNLSIDGSSPDVTTFFLFIVLTPLVSATGTATLLEQNPTFQAPTAHSGTTGTSALLESTPTIPAPTSESHNETTWTNETAPSTTWTNESK